MGDRVRALGNGAGMSQDSLSPELTDLECPVVTTLAKCAKWYWRVKNWQVTVTDLQITAGGDSAEVLVGIPFTVTEQAGSELELIGNRRATFICPCDATEIENGWGMRIFDGSYRQDVNDYRPELFITGAMSLTRDTGSAGILWSTFPDFIGRVDGSMIAKLDGVPFEMFYRVAVTDDGAFTFTTLEITPCEFWPYAGKDGLPIYDTATGLVLPGRDPLM